MSLGAFNLSRIIKLHSILKQHTLDCLLVSLPANISYVTGYISRDSYLLISKKGNFYLTDSRYTEEAKRKLNRVFSVKQANGLQINSAISQLCKKFSLKNAGFEEEFFAFAKYKRLRETLDKTVNLIPTSCIIEELREIKASFELEKIRQATEITIKALQFIKGLIVPGKREIEIAGELERFIRYAGGTGAGFDIIVASGPNSSFPHHITSYRKIKNNEPVLIDMGVDYFGYKSDLTRVFFLGKISVLTLKIYDIVVNAQKKAIGKIKPAGIIAEADAAARSYITQKGYGRYFGHNLGHGIGLKVHELPNISGRNKNTFKQGMIFTVEPAVYLPGKFGIRIEDTVLVTKKGIDIISGALDK